MNRRFFINQGFLEGEKMNGIKYWMFLSLRNVMLFIHEFSVILRIYIV